MRKSGAFCLAVSLLWAIGSGCDSYVRTDPGFLKEIAKHQIELNNHYRDPDESPLEEADRLNFEGLDFFQADQRFKVKAEYIPTPGLATFMMPTSGHDKEFRKHGELHFELDGKPLVLSTYQNMKYIDHPEHGKFLFIPFTDPTNGKTTYEVGRYIDLEIPTENSVWLDFNTCYNPYCAYSDGWNCPIPPAENRLEVAINAGVKKFH